MRSNLESACRKLGKKVNQWSLIALAIEAQLKVSAEDWARSHKRVNKKSSYRVTFKEWTKQLDDHDTLVSGEKFSEKRTSLFDAMHACWTNFSAKHRHEVLTVIKGACEVAAMCDDKVK